MDKIISFIKETVVRAVKRWVQAKLIMLLASLALVAALLLALKLAVDYVKKRLGESEAPDYADLPQPA